MTVAVVRHALPIDAVLSVVTGGSESGAVTVKPFVELVPVFPAASVWLAVAEYAPEASAFEADQLPAVHGAEALVDAVPVIATPTLPSPVAQAPGEGDRGGGQRAAVGRLGQRDDRRDRVDADLGARRS